MVANTEGIPLLIWNSLLLCTVSKLHEESCGSKSPNEIQSPGRREKRAELNRLRHSECFTNANLSLGWVECQSKLYNDRNLKVI